MGKESLASIILAAGKGTRMKSRLPKVLHPLLGKPLLAHVIDLLKSMSVEQIVVVVGHGAELVRRTFNQEFEFVYQQEQLGTGHAVACAKDALLERKHSVLIICGDTPLFQKTTLESFIDAHHQSHNVVSILSSHFENPFGYGRIVRDGSGNFSRIVEEKDATEEEKTITEVNTGTYMVEVRFLFELVTQLECNNAQGEYYLTDIVGLAASKGLKVGAYPFAEEEEALGVNSRAQLARAESVLLHRKRAELMDFGVTLSMPETIYIEPCVEVGQDCQIGPFCVLKGKTVLGEGVKLDAHCYIEDSVISSRAYISAFSKVINGKVLDK